ncbi:MAG: prefoldin subunit [bacterium]
MTNKENSKESENSISPEKMQEIQFLEQNLQNLFFQKQSMQAELSEVNSALKEIDKSDEEVFRIVGQLMIKSNKQDVKKDLLSKKESFEKRLNELNNHEKTLLEKIEEYKKEFFK